MMEGMHAVMQRIHELRQRFGLSRREEAPSPGEGDFSNRIALHLGSGGPLGGVPGVHGDSAGGEMTSAAIRDIVRDHSARNRISPNLVNAIIETESGYDTRAVSPRGAMGLMQLMPDVAHNLGVENPFEPEENIRGGVALLRRLLDKYGGDYTKALAAYNAGEGAVDRSGGVPNYPETREYVDRVIRTYLRNSE